MAMCVRALRELCECVRALCECRISDLTLPPFALPRYENVCKKFNPFRHRLESRRTSARSSEPSTATARLRVTGLTCRLAGPLPGTRARFYSAHIQRVDRLAHVCSLTEDVARVLQAAANDNSGLKSMGASWLLLSRCCPSHASLRLEANFIAPSDVFPPLVALAAFR